MQSTKGKKKAAKAEIKAATMLANKTKLPRNQVEPAAATIQGKKSKKPNNAKAKSGVDQVDRAGLAPKSVQKVSPILPPPKKLERSNTSFFTDKISKIYNKLSGSRENINRINEDCETDTNKPTGFVFTRSRTLSSIQVKTKSLYRRSIRESKLESLNEEDRDSTFNERAVDVPDTPTEPTPRPPPTPILQRSNSILTRLMRKISNAGEKKPDQNSRWSASLQNLQVIDTMVAYDDLSFVNYDKFNTYTGKLERTISQSQRDLSQLESNPTFSRYNSINLPSSPVAMVETTNPVILRRDKKPKPRHLSGRFETDVNMNLDRDKNLYRQSLNSDQLKFLSNVTRDSYRWSENLDRLSAQDFLCLESNQAEPPRGQSDVSSDKMLRPKFKKSVKRCQSEPACEELQEFGDSHLTQEKRQIERFRQHMVPPINSQRVGIISIAANAAKNTPPQPIDNFLQQKQWQQYFYGEAGATPQPTDVHTHLVNNRLPTSPSNPFLMSELVLPPSTSTSLPLTSATTTTPTPAISPNFSTTDHCPSQKVTQPLPPKRPARTKPQLTHQQQSMSFDQTNYQATMGHVAEQVEREASGRLSASDQLKSRSATVSPDPRMATQIEDFRMLKDCCDVRNSEHAAVTATAGTSIGSTTTNVTATRISEFTTGADRTTAASVYELCNEIYNCSYQKPKICDINVVSGEDEACEVRVGMVAEPTGYITLTSSDEPVKTNGKSKNPFLASDCSVNGKRDEFLKATMKICLVVSPPSNRLQLKSRSLTHLDKLEPQIKAQNDILYNNKSKVVDNSTNTTGTTNTSSAKKICCLSSPSSSSIASALSTALATATTTASTTTISIKKKSSSFLHRDYKKPILARSQISSSEYFSVCFDTENGFKEKDEMFVAATKGITLADSLRHALTQRSLSLSQISIIDNGLHNQHELGIPQYLGPLDANTDIGSLAGRTLIVTEKDFKKSGHYLLQKAASVGYKNSKGSKLFSSVSTEECIESHEAVKLPQSKQTTKQRWSLQFFGIKNPQQTQLCEILNNYNKNGVPKSKSSYCNIEYPEFLEAIHALENLPKTWLDFVNCNGMIETETKIQSAIWELVTTEVDYIHALQTVRDLFLACLEGIQTENILIDVDQNKLFSNIHDICEANLKFWSFYLYPMVKHSILTGHQLCVDYFQQGFVTFATIFAPYTKYCAEQSTCQHYCKELNQNNALFTAYLAWCESQKMCNRLRLADILVRPMQRLTKYSLLLTAIRKHIADENDAEIMDAMIHSVEDFVFSVNSHLTTRQENERLKGIMARIEAYDVVDSNNEHLEKMVKQYSVMFDLCAPMKGCAEAQGRHLFMEGDLKFKDSLGKIDVHCFLLTDILLVCKTIAKKGHGTLKIVRQPFYTDKLTIKLRDNVLYCVYFNDLNMVVAAFTLQCSEAKSWHDAITKAKHIYSRLKLGSSWDSYTIKYTNTDMLGVKKSPINSSIGSRVSSLNNSHSGSVELNESKAVSVDFEKANSVSSDEGMAFGVALKTKLTPSNSKKLKPITSNSLTVQPFSGLGQSMPNLNIPGSSNTLLVPGTSKTHSHSHSGQSNLLSPSQRGISYPPPSPTRATLRRGFAFSSSTKNPPLVKTRNVQSTSFNTAQHPLMLGQGLAHMVSSQPVSPQPQLHSTAQLLPPTPLLASEKPVSPTISSSNVASQPDT